MDDVVDEPRDELSHEIPCWRLLLASEVDEVAVQSPAHRAPFVLLDQLGVVDAEGDVVAPQLPELGDDRLEDRRDADRLIHARAHIADPEFQRGIQMMRPNIPPDLGTIRDALRAY